MAWHNGLDVNNGDDQAGKWVNQQHKGTGSVETYNFLVDTLGYSTDSLGSDGAQTSNSHHEQYENNIECMWVRWLNNGCDNDKWSPHTYMPRGDCDQVPANQKENGGAWWREGFYDGVATQPSIEVKFGTDCPSGKENIVRTQSYNWSGGGIGSGYLIKTSLGPYDTNGLDLLNGCGGSLQKLHSTLKSEDDALGC